MKYLNIIILSIIILIVGILIYRWYFKSNEGFIGEDDKLVDTQEVSSYDYLWSNNLYLEQFPKENPPESLIVFQQPKQEGTDIKKILGTMITDSLDKLNKTTTVVSKDVKKPIELKEIFKYNITSEPVFNKLLTYESLNEFKKRNEAVLNTLESSITEFDEIFNKILSNINAQLNVTLFQNSLGETGENKTFETDENGNLIFTLTEGSFNAFKFPIGSKVNITTRSGQQYEIYIPTENMIDNNNSIIDENTITYEKIFKDTGLSQHSFNPFGSYGLGFKNYQINNPQLYINANRMFHYNYAMGNDSSYTGLIEKKELFNYIPKVSTNTSGSNYYIKTDKDKIFFVKHIVEIDKNDTDYPINGMRPIMRKVFKYGTEEGPIDKISGCNAKDGTIDSQYFGMYKPEGCNDGNYTKVYSNRVSSNRNNCALGYRRVWCAEGEPGKDVVFSSSSSGNINVKSIYVNRAWINPTDYAIYENINYTESFNINIIYGSRENYNSILTNTENNTDSELFFSDGATKSFKVLVNMTSLDDFFNIHKRNALACLWHDGEVTFENYCDGTNGINFEYSNLFDSVNQQGPMYSPYITIQFSNKGEAKNFVADILNKLQNTVTVEKFRNPTLELSTITLDNIQTTTSKSNNNMDQIKQNIIDVLQNYNRYADNTQNITDTTITNIQTNITNTINGFSETISLYYFNFMMTLPRFNIDTQGNTQRAGGINLSNGEFIQNEMNNKIRNITVTINKNDNPIYKVLVSNINKLRDNLVRFKTSFISDNKKYIDLSNQIINNQLNHYPLTIHRPIAPPKYKCLGDIVEISGYTDENSSKNYNKNPKEHLELYGCIPEHCVVEARPWLVSDKVYEFRSDGQYVALFRNPYLNTFRAVTQVNSTPEGGVEKIVACVTKSNVINELKHADSCANEYKRGYENVVNSINLDRNNILYDKQEARLQNMLAERQETIDKLKNTISKVQKEDRQAIIINHSMNRKRFQDLLDTQVYNMDQLITNLYSIISININMGELVTKLKERGLTAEKIQEIIDTIRRYNPNDPDTAISIDDATTEGGNQADAVISEPAKLQRIIYRTRDGREQEMILRSLVESSCGCYFTDDEVLKTR